MGLILDTSVVVAAERGQLHWKEFLESVSDEQLFISSITLTEIWHGCHRANLAARQRRLTFVQGVQAMIPVMNFTTNEALIHAEVWAGLEKAGQMIGLHDLLIAATALTARFPLATLNEREFKRIPNLKLRSLREFLIA